MPHVDTVFRNKGSVLLFAHEALGDLAHCFCCCFSGILIFLDLLNTPLHLFSFPRSKPPVCGRMLWKKDHFIMDFFSRFLSLPAFLFHFASQLLPLTFTGWQVLNRDFMEKRSAIIVRPFLPPTPDDDPRSGLLPAAFSDASQCLKKEKEAACRLFQPTSSRLVICSMYFKIGADERRQRQGRPASSVRGAGEVTS